MFHEGVVVEVKFDLLFEEIAFSDQEVRTSEDRYEPVKPLGGQTGKRGHTYFI